MIHREGRVYERVGRSGQRRYYYRRKVKLFENGAGKLFDLRKRLGTNFARALQEAAKLDARVEAMSRGERPRWVETMGQLVEWYGEYVTKERKLLSARTVLSNVRIFLGRVGDIRLEAVTTGTVEAFVAWRRQDRSGSTVAGYLRDIRRMFNVAVGEGMMPSNPAARVKPPAMSRRERRLPSPEELQRMLEYLKTHRLWLYRIVMTLLCTGCRLGEALALTWDRVDLTTGVIRLPRRKVQDDHRVPMAAQLKAVLWAHWMDQQTPKEGPVFVSQAGRPYTPTRVLYAFKPVARGLGMEYMVLKTFRKIAATTAMEATGSIWVAQMLMGHTSSRTTETWYLGRGAQARGEGVQAMEDLLSRMTPKENATETVDVGGTSGTKGGSDR